MALHVRTVLPLQGCVPYLQQYQYLYLVESCKKNLTSIVKNWTDMVFGMMFVIVHETSYVALFNLQVLFEAVLLSCARSVGLSTTPIPTLGRAT
jgi:hypothetical protein